MTDFQRRVLTYLARCEHSSARLISYHLGSSKATATRVCMALVRLGLVEERGTAGPGNWHGSIWWITAEGRAAADEILGSTADLG